MRLEFAYEIETLELPGLALEYFKVPWDTELMGLPVGQLQRVEVSDYGHALDSFKVFESWLADNAIAFCTARIPHSCVLESLTLQAHRFRFMELNYRPERALAASDFDDWQAVRFEAAGPADQAELRVLAATAFRLTRFHLDPLLKPGTGDQRYEAWMKNAFSREQQEVIKCTYKKRIAAFFVQERPQPHHVFWSLVALGPDFQGQGLGKRIWEAALHWLGQNSVTCVSTSISSLNVPVMNLYSRLGFRFPAPEMVFHWHRGDETI